MARLLRLLGLSARAALAALAAISALAGCSVEVDRSSPENECATCHLSDFNAVRRPKHVDAKPVTCAICHTQTSWKPSVLDHPWALSGKHETADCFACHTGTPAKFEGTSKKCFACHEDEFERGHGDEKKKPETTCQDCHTTEKWKPTKKKKKPAESDVDDDDDEPQPKPKPTTTVKPKPTPTTTPTVKPKPKPKPKPTYDPPPDVTTGATKGKAGGINLPPTSD